MKEVNIGLAGTGNMGIQHARSLIEGQVRRGRLAAVCDKDPKRMRAFRPDVLRFADIGTMVASGSIDAALVVTPHYSHLALGATALRAGIHTLVEKPLSVHKADCERLIAAHTDPKVVFAIMFNQRTDNYLRTIRRLVRSGDLGRIRRVNWTVTDWFRSEAYYGMGGWRATWKGEGGGVLLNQCPHHLDLFQWIFGMPVRVRAFCSFGKYHRIEVEDDVTAYMEFADGSTAVFIASTGEAPGTNRLEIAAERGRLVYEDNRITYWRNEVEMTEFSRTTEHAFAAPECRRVEVPANGHGGQHVEVLQNFVDAILDGTDLIAPAAEGIKSVELANAMLLSSLRGTTLDLPMSGAEYADVLDRLSSGPHPEKEEFLAVKLDRKRSS